ncbi:MAG: CpsD/CapB family tyrosine-protein kinase [Clostridium sp.]
MFIVSKDPKSVTAEQYRILRTNIQYSSFDKDIKKILVTSSEPGEGKTTTSANLALTFAQSDKKTIVVDCDLRKPSIHKGFNLSNTVGLSDVILNSNNIDKAIKKVENNLYVLTSGKIPPNPSEMLSSKAFEGLLEALSKIYDVIIIDSPPVLAVTDSQIISTKVDGTVLVVRGNHTKKEVVIAAKDVLDKVKANILGTVLTRAENGKHGYYYYYGSK